MASVVLLSKPDVATCWMAEAELALQESIAARDGRLPVSEVSEFCTKCCEVGEACYSAGILVKNLGNA
eukprot:1133716-Pelagomonas_calceolata.AAC.5